MQPTDISIATERVLDFYRTYINVKEKAPTLTEASQALGIAHSAVNAHLRKLAIAGYVVRRPGIRNVALTDKAL